MDNVAIVGPNGFVGTGLRSHFDRRSIKYVGFSRDTPFVSVETMRNIKSQKFSDVIYLATDLNPAKAELEIDKVNLELGYLAEMLEFLVEVLPEANLIFPSSGGTVYSESGLGKLETDPAEGVNAYGIFKAKCERMISSSSLSHVILRISNGYGKGQRIGRGQGVIAEWMYSAKQGGKVIVIGSLDQSRDYLYIDDLNRAFESAVGTKNLNEIINIGTGFDTSLRELIRLISNEYAGQIIVDQKNGRDFDISHSSLNIDKAHKIFGWKPTVSISSGIKLVWNMV